MCFCSLYKTIYKIYYKQIWQVINLYFKLSTEIIFTCFTIKNIIFDLEISRIGFLSFSQQP